MNIVYCIAATCNSGGMERVLADKANYLVQKGHSVHIITTDQRGEQPFFTLDQRIVCRDLGINYEENNGKSLINKLLHYPYKQFLHKQRLRKLLAQIRADIVVSMFCNEVGFLPSIKDGSKKVLEVHFSKYKRLQYGRRGLWQWVDRYRTAQDTRHVRRYDKFVVLTQEDKEYWGKLPNIIVIPNACHLHPEAPALLQAHKAVAVGRYNTQKNFEALISIWAEVHKQQPDWQLDIIGEGTLKDTLQAQIDSLGLRHIITLQPPTQSIERHYLASSIYLMTSHYEGLPMVLLEAQSCGLPIISYACKCGPKDVISDGETGYLISPDDTQTFVKRLLTIMTHASLRQEMGAQAYVAAQRYKPDRILPQWLKLFQSLS